MCRKPISLKQTSTQHGTQMPERWMDVEQIRGSEQVGEASSVRRRLLQELAPRFPVMPLYRHRGDVSTSTTGRASSLHNSNKHSDDYRRPRTVDCSVKLSIRRDLDAERAQKWRAVVKPRVTEPGAHAQANTDRASTPPVRCACRNYPPGPQNSALGRLN